MKEIIQTAFDNGINFIDTAEAYAAGNSEKELCVFSLILWSGFLTFLIGVVS